MRHIRFGVKACSLSALIGLSLLIGCAPGLNSTAPPDAITSPLPVSVADMPRAAALRTAPRIALVIGNDHYASWPQLQLSGADARAMAQSLRTRGFELIGGGAQTDVSSGRFRELLGATEAAVRANPGAIVVVFFGGHGFADQGHNYLAPTDAPEAGEAIWTCVGLVERH